jgi:YMGG-like Gly-zipper
LKFFSTKKGPSSFHLKIIIMKQALLILTLATFLFACKNKSNNELAIDKNLVLMDTALLHRSGIFSDTGYTATDLVDKNINGTTTSSSTTTTVTTTTTTHSGNPTGEVTTTNSGSNSNKGTSTAGAGTKTTSAGTSTTPAKRDKGWSSAAKGTAIGAGSGAVIGAVVSNNKVKGAVIGGVIGAAGGYAIGRDMDKKSGRVERNKK